MVPVAIVVRAQLIANKGILSETLGINTDFVTEVIVRALYLQILHVYFISIFTSDYGSLLLQNLSWRISNLWRRLHFGFNFSLDLLCLFLVQIPFQIGDVNKFSFLPETLSVLFDNFDYLGKHRFILNRWWNLEGLILQYLSQNMPQNLTTSSLG